MFNRKIINDKRLSLCKSINSDSKYILKKYNFSSKIGIEYENVVLDILRDKILLIRKIMKFVQEMSYMYNFSLVTFFNHLCDKKTYHVTIHSVSNFLHYFSDNISNNDEFSNYYFQDVNQTDYIKKNEFIKSKIFISLIDSFLAYKKRDNENLDIKYDNHNFNKSSLENVKISYIEFVQFMNLFLDKEENYSFSNSNFDEFEENRNFENLQNHKRENDRYMDEKLKTFDYDYNFNESKELFYPVLKNNSYSKNKKYDYIDELKEINPFNNNILRNDVNVKTFSKNVKLYLDKRKDCYIQDFVEYFNKLIKCEREIKEIKQQNFIDEETNTEEIFLYFLGKKEKFSDHLNSVNIHSAFTKIGRIHTESIEAIDLLIKRYDSSFKKYMVYRDFVSFISPFKEEDKHRLSQRLNGEFINTNIKVSREHDKMNNHNEKNCPNLLKNSNYFEKMNLKNPYLYSYKEVDRNTDYNKMDFYDSQRSKNFNLRHSTNIVKPTSIRFLNENLDKNFNNNDCIGLDSHNNLYDEKYENLLSMEKSQIDLKNSIQYYKCGLLPGKTIDYLRKISNKILDCEISLNCYRKKNFSSNLKNLYYKFDQYKNEVKLLNKEMNLSDSSKNSMVEFDINYYFKKLTNSDFITLIQVRFNFNIFFLSFQNF